jgi:hypothetical protein
MAQTQARAGKIKDAMRSARWPRDQGSALRRLRRSPACLYAVASTLEMARSVDDPWERSTVLEHILDSQLERELLVEEETASSSARAEAPDEELGVVAAFTGSKQRATVLAIIAATFANACRPAEAVALAEAIDTDKPRGFASGVLSPRCRRRPA